MGLPDGGGVLVAKRQEVEELSQVEQSVHVVLKSTVSDTCEHQTNSSGKYKPSVCSAEKGFLVS